MFNWFQRSSKSPTRRPGAIRQERAAVRTPGAAVRVALPAGDTQALAALPDAARQLSLDAQRVLASLPRNVRPARCCTLFPHALEKLLGSWRDPSRFRTTMDSMLIDRRGGRQGFPFEIVTELSALREYYDLYVNPIRRSAWESIDIR